MAAIFHPAPIGNIAALLGGAFRIAPGMPAAPCMPHGRKRSSPVSFKLESIIALYTKKNP